MAINLIIVIKYSNEYPQYKMRILSLLLLSTCWKCNVAAFSFVKATRFLHHAYPTALANSYLDSLSAGTFDSKNDGENENGVREFYPQRLEDTAVSRDAIDIVAPEPNAVNVPQAQQPFSPQMPVENQRPSMASSSPQFYENTQFDTHDLPEPPLPRPISELPAPLVPESPVDQFSQSTAQYSQNFDTHNWQIKPTRQSQSFDPHNPKWGFNGQNERNWYDPQPTRERDIIPESTWPLKPRPQNQMQRSPRTPAFDPHALDWSNRPPLSTNIQDSSWFSSPSDRLRSYGGLDPLSSPPPLPQEQRQFDPHNPDWGNRPLSKEIQGDSRSTWQNDIGVDRVMVDLYSDGMPIETDLELWQGPSNTPHKLKLYSEDGGSRPFKAVIETPGYGSAIDVKNTGPLEFPIKASIQPFLMKYVQERFKLIQGENSLYTVPLSDVTTSVLICLETDGMPLMAQIELWQGPDNTPQKMKVYNEQGLPFQIMVETPFAGNTIAIRNIGPATFPLYASCSSSMD